MNWMLFIMLYGGDGVTSSTIPMDSQELCEQAANFLLSQKNINTRVFCFKTKKL